MRMKKKPIYLYWACLILAVGCPGCARYRPSFRDNAAYFQRVKTQAQDAVTVSVAGLSAAESEKTFGADLAKRKILPVWLKIENHSPKNSYLFLERGIDPDYYTAGEAAYIARIVPGLRFFERPLLRPLSLLGFLVMPVDYFFVRSANVRMRETFTREALQYGWIEPGQTEAGFVFVPFELGVKHVTVDLYGDELKRGKENLKRFDFFIEIPGIRADYRTKEFEHFYAPHEIQHWEDEQTFKTAVEALPACVTDRSGTKTGDPVNLVVVGTLEEILEAFTTAEWDETEAISLTSIMRMAGSFSFKKAYNYSPVSSLYLYGRSQDIALQKARSNIKERMHLRLWLSPMRFDGKPVWVGQASRDIGVRFTLKTWNLMTHQIDPDIDEAAVYAVSDLIYRHRVDQYGIVTGGAVRTPEQPGRNLTGDPFYTSGIKAVIVLPEKQAPRTPGRLFLS